MSRNKRSVGLFYLLVIGFIAVIIALVLWLSGLYADSRYADKHAGCTTTDTVHKVTIDNERVTPNNIVAYRCEKITITNLDKAERLIAFGQHEDHVQYDGIEETLLRTGKSMTITLVQTGSFLFHDHEHDEIQGTFTVN